jgi:ABC-2 type transport system permease protein
MRRLFHILRNDVRRHLKSPLAMLVFIAIPLVMTGMIGIIFGPRTEGSQLPPITVLLVDHDKNLASRLLLGAFDSDQLKKMFQVTVCNEAEGGKRMDRGKASAMVVVPERFTLDLLDGKPTTLTVVKNPAEEFLPDVVEEFMKTMAVMLSGAVQAFSEEARGIRAMLDSPLESVSWAALAPELDQAQKKIIAAKTYLSPLLLRLGEKKTKAQGEKTQISRSELFALILPGMAVMFLLFIVQNLMRNLLTEREDGKQRRMLSSPLRPLELIGARLLGGWLMGLIVLLIMVAVGSLIFHVAWGPFGYLLMLCIAAAFWCAALFALLHALFRNRNQAGAFSAPIILVFSLFGGSMMSLNAMPAAFRAIGLLTPNRWFIDGAALVRDGRCPTTALLVLTVSGIVLLALAVPALRRRTV